MSSSAFPNAQNQAAGAIPVWATSVPGISIATGQQAVTGSAAPLASQPVVSTVTLTASAAGAYLGGAGVTTSTGFPIPTAGITIPFNGNLNTLYIVGTGTVSWLAR